MADKAVKLTQFRSSTREIKQHIDNVVAAIPKFDGDHDKLSNLPKIEGVEVKGVKTAEDYNLVNKQYVETQIGNIEVLLKTI